MSHRVGRHARRVMTLSGGGGAVSFRGTGAKARCWGSTLLELLIASSIMAVIMTVLLTAFVQGIRVSQEREERGKSIRQMGVVLETIMKDLGDGAVELLAPQGKDLEKGSASLLFRTYHPKKKSQIVRYEGTKRGEIIRLAYDPALLTVPPPRILMNEASLTFSAVQGLLTVAMRKKGKKEMILQTMVRPGFLGRGSHKGEGVFR